MLRHRFKTGDLASRSERNTALIRTLSEAFRVRHKEYTNLRILAANEDTLLATKSCDELRHLVTAVLPKSSVTLLVATDRQCCCGVAGRRNWPSSLTYFITDEYGPYGRVHGQCGQVPVKAARVLTACIETALSCNAFCLHGPLTCALGSH